MDPVSLRETLRCEIRCYVHADVDELIRWLADVASSGMSGFDERLRTVVEVGMGLSSVKDKSGEWHGKEPAEKEEEGTGAIAHKAVWRAAGKLGYPFGPGFRLNLLTGCRQGE
jgi:hypothetical protein